MRAFAPGTERRLLLAGGVMFGAFLVVAFTFRRLDVSQETLSLVGGAFAYGFLLTAAVILVIGWRRRGVSMPAAIARFLEGHPAVVRAVGSPITVEAPPAQGGPARGHAQANVRVTVTGPQGSAVADLVMARLDREWEVLSGALEGEGRRVPLGGAARG